MRIALAGDFISPTGYASHARNLLKSLELLGESIKIENLKQGVGIAPIEEDTKAKFISLSGASDKPDIRICLMTPPYYHFEDDVKTIGFTMWETSNICNSDVPGQTNWNWTAQMNKCHSIWTGCQDSVDAFRRSGVTVPIHIVPGPVDTNIFRQKDTKELEILDLTVMPDGTPIPRESRPMVVGYIGDWTARKNIDNWIKMLVSQFILKPVAGLLKTRIPGYHLQNQLLVSRVNEIRTRLRMGTRRPPIHLISETLSETEMVSLYQSMDCYLSLSRGEGLDLPTLQAMACGVPVVHTSYGATRDYLTGENGFPIQYTYTIVEGGDAGPYFSNMWWAEPDLHAATKAVGEIFSLMEEEGPNAFSELKANARATVMVNHSVPAIAKLIREILGEIKIA